MLIILEQENYKIFGYLKYFYYNKVMFTLPKTKLIFKPDKNLLNLFNNIPLNLYEVEQIENGSFDWFNKTRN